MVQKHDIDVAKWIELATSVSTKGDQCEGGPGRCVSASGGCGSAENVLQQNINKLSPPCANFATASARLVFQAQPMFLNLKEFFIKRENLCRTSRARGGKLIRRVGQDLFEMPGCRHFGF
ncbi:MAG: hypothetical protein DME75_08675 [Verrucomicrobia bacterium]|nr:MAG: hypothetical protein DME75_08675 [Verrucomicrobiota bacterium]